MNYSAQIAEFEDVLNWNFNKKTISQGIQFDLSLTREQGIYIKSNDKNRVYIFNKHENHPLYIFNNEEYEISPKPNHIYIKNNKEYTTERPDFIVHVPSTVKAVIDAFKNNVEADIYPEKYKILLIPLKKEIKRTVDKYRLSGTKYKVIFDDVTVYGYDDNILNVQEQKDELSFINEYIANN